MFRQENAEAIANLRGIAEAMFTWDYEVAAWSTLQDDGFGKRRALKKDGSKEGEILHEKIEQYGAEWTIGDYGWGRDNCIGQWTQLQKNGWGEFKGAEIDHVKQWV